MTPHFVPILGALIGLPPPIALVGTFAFVFFLLRRDIRQRPNITGAVWLPVIWVVLMGSRSVVQWLYIFHFPIALGSPEEGNPLDAVVYSSLIIAGLCVLNNRGVSLSEVFENNRWLMAFLLYCFIAILWSDFPFVAFKHWIKVLGHPIMALVLFTEPDPNEALIRLMKRSAYFLVPFSIMAIKWFPEIGRRFDTWTGVAENCGISQTKNMLGLVCLVLGFFFVWYFLRTWRAEKSKARQNELRLIGAFLFMIGWLLAKAHSATSSLSLLFAVIVMLLVRRRWVNKTLIGRYALLAVIVLVLAELTFGISDRIVHLTGHESTIVGRAELWRECLALHTNPIFGVGFESFWLGDRPKLLQEERFWQLNEAHNGYLETYLNLGVVGLFMLFCLIIATFRKIRLDLLRDSEWGGFELGFLVAALFHNWTESSFRGLGLVWFVFYIIAMNYPRGQLNTMEEPSDLYVETEEVELAWPDRI